MKISFVSLFIGLCGILFSGNYAFSQSKPIIYEIKINREIGSTSWIYLQKGLREAEKLDVKVIVLHLNTYGGSVVEADSMRSAILYNSIPVYAFIDNNAASAGALISIACKKIYMRKGGNIGAATVVNQTGEQMPDKYQSYMRSTIRSTAEYHGKDTIVNGKDTIYKWKRDPKMAEAMVDGNIFIPNLIDSGKVLTLTADEALQYGFCDGIADNVDEVVKKYLNYPEYQLVTFKPSLFDNIKGFLFNPFFQAILIMIIIGGIYFELQTPGIGFAGIAAAVAAVLYFSPLYLDGLAQYWEILLFIVGLILIAIEIFVIPGFGVTGILGISFSIIGLMLAMINNIDFNFEQVDTRDISRSLLTVGSGVILGFGALLYLSSRIGHRGLLKKLALETDVNAAINSEYNLDFLIGKEGEAQTVLRPSGKVIIEGEIYDAVSEMNFIQSGEKVIVVKVEAAQVYVKKI